MTSPLSNEGALYRSTHLATLAGHRILNIGSPWRAKGQVPGQERIRVGTPGCNTMRGNGELKAVQIGGSQTQLCIFPGVLGGQAVSAGQAVSTSTVVLNATEGAGSWTPC